jgi:formate dehydrogenase major subunit
MLVGEGFDFKDGLFSGYDAQKRSYDKSKWALQMDANGVPRRDLTLQDKRCVFQLLKAHYARYNLSLVSKITGTPEKDLVEVYKVYAATGAKGKAGTIMYAMGWTQHTVGVQNIRTMSIIQSLLGNMGVAGGGLMPCAESPTYRVRPTRRFFSTSFLRTWQRRPPTGRSWRTTSSAGPRVPTR